MLLIILYLSLWNALKKQRGLHLLLGWLACFAALTLLAVLLLALFSLQQPLLLLAAFSDPLPVVELLLHNFMASPLLWLLSAYCFATGIGFTGSLGQLWLITRRTKADYGRDYYTFAMHYTARWAIFGTLAAAALAGGTIWQLQEYVLPELGQQYEPGLLLVAFGLPLVCCLLWACVLRSATPMRHKPGAVFAFFFLYAALCAQILSFINALPTP